MPELSLHPPHLVDVSGAQTPAALIPFCAYQSDMSVFGSKIQDLPVPVCNSFQPVLLEGQLCYSLNFTLLGAYTSNSGKKGGLVILVDQGAKDDDYTEEETLSVKSLSLEDSGNSESSVRIYLNTLASFTDSRAGSYALTSLKKMTATAGFLKQADDQKKCKTETLEDCQARKYVEQVQEKCGCVPWALSSLLQNQV